ncbi:MAG: hypothetical protein IH888_04130 [Planctomycetes bacterium]|nr:hypothetical protein [Planctomycetota bacterium]
MQMTKQPFDNTALGRSRWLRPAALVIGVALLTSAIAVVVGRRHLIGEALEALGEPRFLDVLVLLAAVPVNLFLTGLLFYLLIRRYGRVGFLEMQALLAASTLVNFVPLRPGLFGRIAYHKTINAIPATDSAKTVAQAVLLSLLVAAYLAGALLVGSWGGVPLWMAVGLPVPLLAAGTINRPARVWCAAAGVRYLEVMVWALRYHAAFSLLGVELGPTGALALACVSMVAMLAPLTGNGLGVREWAIGLAARLLPQSDLVLGLTADLLNRTAELIMVLLLGLVGMGWLAWRVRKSTVRNVSSAP